MASTNNPDPITITILIGGYREPAPPLDSLNPYNYFDHVLTRFKEISRFIFSMRPEVTGVEFGYQGINILMTPQLAKEPEEAEGYKDSTGY